MENNKPDYLDKIHLALDSIRPYLHADGGDVRFVELTEDMIVMVEMLGSCESCKISPMTLKAGVEQAVISAVPQVKGVRAVNVTMPS